MNMRTKFLLAIVFALGAVYFWPQGDVVPPGEPAAPPAETVPEPRDQVLPSGNPLALFPASAYGDLLERPLFSQSRRRPPEIDTAQEEPAAEAVGLTLLGVFAKPAPGAVLLQAADGSAAEYVALEGEFQGWKLVAVTPISATLENESGQVTLALPVPAPFLTPEP